MAEVIPMNSLSTSGAGSRVCVSLSPLADEDNDDTRSCASTNSIEVVFIPSLNGVISAKSAALNSA